MIVTVCFNPSIDRAVSVERFAYGGTNRVLDRRVEGGGKGVNVAAALGALGEEALCAGLLPEGGREYVMRRLEEVGVRQEMIAIEGNVRVNSKIHSLADGVSTEVNEPGASVSAADFAAVEAVIAKQRATYLVLSGSLPPGCPADAYARLSRANPGARTVLDADGAALLEGLKAEPFLIKPNHAELERALSRALPTPRELLSAARELVGERMAVVSLGAEGAVFSWRGQGFFAQALPVPVQSAVGAGDCMVAGLVYALARDLSPEEIFRCGMAAGAAGCMTPGTGLLREEDFSALRGQVEVRVL